MATIGSIHAEQELRRARLSPYTIRPQVIAAAERFDREHADRVLAARREAERVPYSDPPPLTITDRCVAGIDGWAYRHPVAARVLGASLWLALVGILGVALARAL